MTGTRVIQPHPPTTTCCLCKLALVQRRKPHWTVLFCFRTLTSCVHFKTCKGPARGHGAGPTLPCRTLPGRVPAVCVRKSWLVAVLVHQVSSAISLVGQALGSGGAHLPKGKPVCTGIIADSFGTVHAMCTLGMCAVSLFLLQYYRPACVVQCNGLAPIWFGVLFVP